jgi:hypothetical protein
MNNKIIFYSIVAFGFLALMYLVDWLFIIGAVIFMYFNQRELSKKYPKNSNSKQKTKK